MASSKVRNGLLLLSLWTLLWIAHLATYERAKVTHQVSNVVPSTNACSVNVSDSRCKKILLWNDADRIEAASFGRGHEAFVRHRCPINDCYIATHPSDIPLESFDAILIFIQQVHLFMKKLPPAHRRTANQRFVMLSQEPPTMLPIEFSDYDNYFNWTMTYRTNSDIPFLYGRVLPSAQIAIASGQEIESKIRATHHLPVNYAVNKTALVAWMVSHCQTYSQREEYVRQLRRYVDVDVYGKCGRFKCRRWDKHWLSYPHCYDMIEQRYKFYLSFENSICTDYVTEKFFRILEHNVVPIVFGGADYAAIAPAHSYIDALQYTPEQLADYLHLLDSNDTLYNEFFWWKPFYSVEASVTQTARHGFCHLCAKLHSDTSHHVHRSLVAEWSNQTQCRRLPQSIVNSVD